LGSFFYAIANTMSHQTIKDWNHEDRPREKMMTKGRKIMTDAELLAILITTGNKKETAMDLARKLLARFNNDIQKLFKADWKEFTAVSGIGQAKAITIAAALELGRRKSSATPNSKPKIHSSGDAYNLLKSSLSDLTEEYFFSIFLNNANEAIAVEPISFGGMTSVMVDPRVVLRKALELKAIGIILAHNHPSNLLKPSKADIDLTQKLQDGAKLLELKILDHLIISDHHYYSMADEGVLPT
jgi:DNA repair protein RadC